MSSSNEPKANGKSNQIKVSRKTYGNEEPDGAEQIGIVHVAGGVSQHQITNGRQDGLRVLADERSVPVHTERNNTSRIISSVKFNNRTSPSFPFFLRLVTLMSRIIPVDKAGRGRSTWLRTGTSYLSISSRPIPLGRTEWSGPSRGG